VRALSVRQPWAWAIIHAGKDVENRTWSTRHRGPLAIHATKCSRSEYESAAREIEAISGTSPPPLAELPTGAVVGVVDLVDCHGDETENDWAQEGAFWWFLASPIPCEPPVPMRGRLGLFEIGLELGHRDVAVVSVAAQALG
jgi:hypothetical protein